MALAYDPNRSKINEDALGKWLKAPMTGDLLQVPQIGPAIKQTLINNGIGSSYALIGKYLLLQEEDTQPAELAQRFFLWLDSIDVHAGSRSSIVQAIAEKVNVKFPGLYDPSLYEAGDDDN